jgi:hypothetical protein
MRNFIQILCVYLVILGFALGLSAMGFGLNPGDENKGLRMALGILAPTSLLGGWFVVRRYDPNQGRRVGRYGVRPVVIVAVGLLFLVVGVFVALSSLPDFPFSQGTMGTPGRIWMGSIFGILGLGLAGVAAIDAFQKP